MGKWRSIMNRRAIHDMILPEEGYAGRMETVVEPYLAARMTTGYCEREQGKRIFYARCLADRPKGIVIISHGYTETIEKHLENIYYFLQGGYHVFMPEHCGHGRSYRLCEDAEDLSLVHVDDYRRYVEDLLFVSRLAAEEFPKLPICLYGHSMGGGIAAAAAAQADGVFSRLILSAPMIRPGSAPVPWLLACVTAKAFCAAGKSTQYVMRHTPYGVPEVFADSASVSQARFDYYQKKRRQEPLFQMNAASYGWLWQAARLNAYLQIKAWRAITCPVLVFQATCDTYVSNREQERFVRKLNRNQKGNAKLIRVRGVKHEIFNAGPDVLERYWRKILQMKNPKSKSMAKSVKERKRQKRIRRKNTR